MNRYAADLAAAHQCRQEGNHDMADFFLREARREAEKMCLNDAYETTERQAVCMEFAL